MTEVKMKIFRKIIDIKNCAVDKKKYIQINTYIYIYIPVAHTKFFFWGRELTSYPHHPCASLKHLNV